jgi:hypothetical protein
MSKTMSKHMMTNARIMKTMSWVNNLFHLFKVDARRLKKIMNKPKKKKFEVQWVLECKNQTQIFWEAAWSLKKLDLVMCFSNMKAKKNKMMKKLKLPQKTP